MEQHAARRGGPQPVRRRTRSLGRDPASFRADIECHVRGQLEDFYDSLRLLTTPSIEESRRNLVPPPASGPPPPQVSSSPTGSRSPSPPVTRLRAAQFLKDPADNPPPKPQRKGKAKRQQRKVTDDAAATAESSDSCRSPVLLPTGQPEASLQALEAVISGESNTSSTSFPAGKEDLASQLKALDEVLATASRLRKPRSSGPSQELTSQGEVTLHNSFAALGEDLEHQDSDKTAALPSSGSPPEVPWFTSSDLTQDQANSTTAQQPSRSNHPAPDRDRDTGGWTTVTRRINRPKVTRVATVLFTPREKNTSFRATIKEHMSAYLYGQPGVIEVRLNRKRNIVAADVSSQEARDHLLTLKSLLDIPVRSFEASRMDFHVGTIFGVDREVREQDIAEGIEADVEILGVRRRGHPVSVRFAAPPPNHVYINGMKFAVRPLKARPLQCTRCGAFNHVSAACTRPDRCSICGGSHHTRKCTSSTPKCFHCGGRHRAADPSCPKWRHQQQLTTALRKTTTPEDRRQVLNELRPLQPTGSGSTQFESYSKALQSRSPKHPSVPAREPPQQPVAVDIQATLTSVTEALRLAVQALMTQLPPNSGARRLGEAAALITGSPTTRHHGQT